MSPIFTLYKPDFECLTPFEIDYLRTESNTSTESYTGLEKLFLIPGEKCEIKTGDYRSCMDQTDPKNCITAALTSNRTTKCQNFRYTKEGIGSSSDEKFTSMVTEFDLVCDKSWIPATLTSMTPVRVY